MPPDRKIPRPHANPDKSSPGEIYLEFKMVGNAMKVSAIDADTGTEISIIGPRNASRDALVATAVNKLKYVMAKA